MTEATIEAEVVETTALAEYDSKLPAERHAELVDKFKQYGEDVRELLVVADGIEVSNVEDKEEMALARKTRLGLRSIRSGVENTRKELKAESLLYGKAVDGMARMIKDEITPTESALQEMEDFAKRAEEERIAQVIRERTAKLEAYEVDAQDYDLGSMTDKAYESLLENSRLGYQARKDAEAAEVKRQEEARVADEKAETERKEQEAAEREKMRAANEALQKKADAEKKKRGKEVAARKAAEEETARLNQLVEDRKREEQERIRKASQEEAARVAAAKQAEIDTLRKVEEDRQAALAAPDKDKLEELAGNLCEIQFPSVKSDVALKAIREAQEMMTTIVLCLRAASQELGE